MILFILTLLGLLSAILVFCIISLHSSTIWKVAFITALVILACSSLVITGVLVGAYLFSSPNWQPSMLESSYWKRTVADFLTFWPFMDPRFFLCSVVSFFPSLLVLVASGVRFRRDQMNKAKVPWQARR